MPDSQAENVEFSYEKPLCNEHVVKKGKTKVLEFHKTVLEKLNKLATIATYMGPAYPRFRNQIYRNLTAKEFAQMEKRRKRKLDELLQKRHQVPDNAILRKSGADIQPRLLGMIVFSELRLDLHMEDLDKELEA